MSRTFRAGLATGVVGRVCAHCHRAGRAFAEDGAGHGRPRLYDQAHARGRRSQAEEGRPLSLCVNDQSSIRLPPDGPGLNRVATSTSGDEERRSQVEEGDRFFCDPRLDAWQLRVE